MTENGRDHRREIMWFISEKDRETDWERERERREGKGEGGGRKREGKGRGKGREKAKRESSTIFILNGFSVLISVRSSPYLRLPII